ncbi:DgyrCDS3600 [Dimorphilus gyrociliatus]|uniref:Ubiquitin carboxyl-terminal hydrolase n=1 Tax=Dimorphilus gyrociliatus TaxID=2664684 RepID=A0A7I8VE74_9ANNE|nr:DgyrCDS3600 [Dimorphilus gyrociliatus]
MGEYRFTDIFGFDADLLCMVPRPVLGLVLLYPLTEKSESGEIGKEDQKSDLYYTKQTIGNACGTVGLIHILANTKETLNIKADSIIGKFLEATKSMSPQEKAVYLEKDESFGATHEVIAQQGQTQASLDSAILYMKRASPQKSLESELDNLKIVDKSSKTSGNCITRKLKPIFESKNKSGSMRSNRSPNPQQDLKVTSSESSIDDCPGREDKVDLHFIAFVHSNGTLYELDGRKNGPTAHGPTTPDNLLEDTVAVVKKFMARDPDQMHFNLVALAKNM